MGYLLDREIQITLVTASSIKTKKQSRRIVIEGHPEYAVVQLAGARGKYPVPWEGIFQLAIARHRENLRIERKASRVVPYPEDGDNRAKSVVNMAAVKLRKTSFKRRTH